MKEALWWESLGDDKVKCVLCPNACVIVPGSRCLQGEENRGGRLYSLNYGQVASICLDPIEKKPLFHFHPGALVLRWGLTDAASMRLLPELEDFPGEAYLHWLHSRAK